VPSDPGAPVPGPDRWFYGRFVSIVARSRKLDEARVRSLRTGASTRRGSAVLELIDQIGYLEDDRRGPWRREADRGEW
jgi:hypothetical protein